MPKIEPPKYDRYERKAAETQAESKCLYVDSGRRLSFFMPPRHFGEDMGVRMFFC
jgi:hypothetical protein